MFAVIWYVTEMDIRSTLANVCRKVTRDKVNCTDAILMKRCQALKLLGEYFLARGGSAETGLNDLKARLKHQQQAAASEDKTEEQTEAKEDTNIAAPSTPVSSASAPAAESKSQVPPASSASQETSDLD